MSKTPQKNYDISHDLSSAEFSVTNDDFDATQSQKIEENSADINNSSTSNKVPLKVKSYFGNRRLLKAINQQDSTQKSFMGEPEENLFRAHHRTSSNISNITAIDALNHTRNIPFQFEAGDEE